MQIQTGRDPRAITGGVSAAALFDPESGQPVVYSSRTIGIPGTAMNAVLFDVDLTAVMTALVQLRGTWAATVVFETTIDETNWFSIAGLRPDSPASAPVSTSTANVVLAFSAIGRRLRARVSAYTSGAVESSVLLTDVPVVSLSNGRDLTLGSGNNVVGAVTLNPSTTGGCSVAKVRSAATTNMTLVKSSAGRVIGWRLYNNTASLRFVKFYNKASAPTTSDVPVFTLILKPNEVADFDTAYGTAFATGIGYSITGALADNDATAVAVDDVVGAIFFA
ncbi:hypothetical protein [Caulobacter vibrioides]|uniref:Uncharacterized protein n=1 Tax=Caulobacter phage S2B TaxID=2759120 RepID=A0AAE7SYJ6_9CAUD|nr:hypothetical protein [Caulobacter vibrioides]QOC54118.1 hypothetical protein [Caulobacter phage S2B]QXZ50202.1 hypothetical protein KZH45_09725 [Caulobacter vibrioides]